MAAIGVSVDNMGWTHWYLQSSPAVHQGKYGATVGSFALRYKIQQLGGRGMYRLDGRASTTLPSVTSCQQLRHLWEDGREHASAQSQRLISTGVGVHLSVSLGDEVGTL